MPTEQPEKPRPKTAKELADQLSQRFAAEHAEWVASPQGRAAAARAAEWNAKTPEEKAASLEALRRNTIAKPRQIDEFTGMDDEEANFLRHWLGE